MTTTTCGNTPVATEAMAGSGVAGAMLRTTAAALTPKGPRLENRECSALARVEPRKPFPFGNR